MRTARVRTGLDRLRRLTRRAGRALAGGARAIGRIWPELLTAAAWLGGWALVTWGVAELTTRWLWPISAGVLLLCLGGRRLLVTVLNDGLYVLSRSAKSREES